MTVVRGGRASHVSKEDLEREATAAKERAATETRQREEDLRFLLTRPEFVRWTRYLLEESGAFTVRELYTAEVYALNARAAFGLKIWNWIAQSNPRSVLEFLDLTNDTPETK